MKNYQIKIKHFGNEKIYLATRIGNKLIYDDMLGAGSSEIDIRNKSLIDYWKHNKP